MAHPSPEPRTNPRAASRTPGRRERVLGLAAGLAADLADAPDALDLDTIDGEFYWRCCRVDLLEKVGGLCANQPRMVTVLNPFGRDDQDRPTGELAADIGSTEVFDYLRGGLRIAEDFLHLIDRAEGVYPEVVWRRLLDGERVAMRAAEAEVRQPVGRAPGDTILLLRVFSGAWTGQQVEDEVRRLATAWSEWSSPDRAAGRVAGGEVAVRVGFALGNEARATGEPPGGELPRYPYVEVAVQLPLPPKNAIAREYDALVRDELRWHRHLPGSSNRQDKEVAIRTWAVGLLAVAGEAVNDAIAAVEYRTGLPGVSQTRFGQDRQRLLDRVSEARPYLYARDPTIAVDARAKAPPALANHRDTADLANPEQGDSSLQV